MGPPYWAQPPGVTGIAQVLGGRTAEESWMMDSLYIRHHSAWMDLQICALSFVINILGKRRVRRWLRKDDERWRSWLVGSA